MKDGRIFITRHVKVGKLQNNFVLFGSHPCAEQKPSYGCTMAIGEL